MIFKKTKFFQKLRQLQKQIGVFELLAGSLILLVLIFIMLQTRSKKEWFKVEVKISSPFWWQQFAIAPPFWLGESIKPGDQEFDPQGKKIAEVIDVKTYEEPSEGGSAARKDIFLTLNLLASRDRRTNLLKFKSKPLGVGSPIELQLNNTITTGLIVYIEGIPDERKEQEIIIEGVWMNTFPWNAEAIPVDGKMEDGSGRIIAQILDKRIELAEKTVETDDGRLVSSRDPLKRDVYLTIKLKVKRKGDNLYFREDQKVKIGENLFIQLPGIDAKWISVMKIFDKDGKQIY